MGTYILLYFLRKCICIDKRAPGIRLCPGVKGFGSKAVRWYGKNFGRFWETKICSFLFTLDQLVINKIKWGRMNLFCKIILILQFCLFRGPHRKCSWSVGSSCSSAQGSWLRHIQGKIEQSFHLSMWFMSNRPMWMRNC